MASIEISGHSLDYVEHGSGEPLVLVHGSASDRRTWQARIPGLAKSFRTVAYSRRHHWPNASIPDGADYVMQDHVDDLTALLDALELAPAHLVGHSYGAFVCLLVAIQNPGRVRSLVLTEPPVLTLFASNEPLPVELVRLLLSRPGTALEILRFGARGFAPARAAVRAGRPDEALEVFGRAVLGREAFESLSAERFAQVRDNFIGAEFTGSGFAPVRAGEIRSVRAPTLLLTGSRSPKLFHRFTDRLEELLPVSERQEIPGASHLVHEDNGPLFERVVVDFLTGRGRQGASSPSP